jgi:phage shock protein E
MLAQPTPVAQDIPFPEVSRINVKDAKAAFDIGNAVFIDVRGEPVFSDGHIPGAISITYDEIMDRLGELDSAAWIIPYCT